MSTRQAGDEFARLYEAHAPALLAYVSLRMSAREDARDLLVEVFMAALEDTHFPRLGATEQRGWLWRVTRNKLVDYYRVQQRRGTASLETYSEALYANEREEPEEVALRSEEVSRLHLFIHEHLTPLQQQILHLRFARDLRSREIADVIGKSEGAVRTQLSRTLNLLRTLHNKL